MPELELFGLLIHIAEEYDKGLKSISGQKVGEKQSTFQLARCAGPL